MCAQIVSGDNFKTTACKVMYLTDKFVDPKELSLFSSKNVHILPLLSAFIPDRL